MALGLWLGSRYVCPRLSQLLPLSVSTVPSGALRGRPACAGWASCTGAPEQQWTLTDGLLYNEYMDMCINEQPLCMVDYTVFLNEPSAVSE